MQAAWHHGSPSTCIGNFFFIFMITDEHWAKRFPEERRPVRTVPICKQFSKPTTSISLSPISKADKMRACWYFIRIYILELNFGWLEDMGIVIMIPWTAAERSGSIRLLLLTEDISLLANNIFSFLFFLDVALALESPHIFLPPCVEGMFRKVIPWRVGPSEMFKGTPSHYNS